MKDLKDEWYINEVGVKPTHIWGTGSELEKGILFRGTKDDMLKKLEEITGRKIELNIHKTEFILTKGNASDIEEEAPKSI